MFFVSISEIQNSRDKINIIFKNFDSYVYFRRWILTRSSFLTHFEPRLPFASMFLLQWLQFLWKCYRRLESIEIYGSIVAKRVKSVLPSSCGSSHQRCSMKIVLLKMSQNSQENTCARVFFWTLIDSATGIFLWVLRNF